MTKPRTLNKLKLCNRCNVQLPAEPGVCLVCGCPEYRLVDQQHENQNQEEENGTEGQPQ
jgi:hypothetical protein